MNHARVRMTARLALVEIILVVSAPLAALAEPEPVGDEFLVNTYTTGPQRLPSVCTAGGSDFVVAWEDGTADYSGLKHGVDGSETATVARRLGGDPPSGDFDFLVNSYTTGRQGQPSVACFDDGGFVVVWSEAETYFPPLDEGRFAVVARRYHSTRNVSRWASNVLVAMVVSVPAAGMAWSAAARKDTSARRIQRLLDDEDGMR